VAAHRPTNVLEYGAYVGYTSSRMALYLRPWGGQIITMEMDPVHVCITRNIVLLEGLEDQIAVQIGHSDEAVPALREKCGKSFFDMVFMDQRSTRFHGDLGTLEKLEMLRPGCCVVADNVLKPGAPRWLWRITMGSGYSSDIVSVREFGSAETEDWMTVTFLPLARQAAVEIPREPRGMAALTSKADRMRFKTVARSFDDARSEMEEVNREFTQKLAAMGIQKSMKVCTRYESSSSRAGAPIITRAVSTVEPWTRGDPEGWSGEDPRMEMRGGTWQTDSEHCRALFPRAGATDAR